MTIDDFIATYTNEYVGTGDLRGQCGSLVRKYWIEVDKTSPESYPNSKDYWFNPVTGYDKVSTPQKGDIAIYNGHGIYTEGHSAIYYDGRVFEQNADPDGSPAHLYNRSNTYLLGYLRKQGASMDLINKDDTDLLRIAHSEIGGWNYEDTHSGKNDATFHAAWDGHSWRELIRTQWTNGAAYRAERDQLKAENASLKEQLAAAEKKLTIDANVTVTKPVETSTTTLTSDQVAAASGFISWCKRLLGIK